MTRRFTRLAWAAAAATYFLIILGAIVRITGSGLGCGEHWPLCNGRLLPPLDLPTLIEYGHRLAALAVTVLVVAVAIAGWRLASAAGPELQSARRLSVLAVILLTIQIALGAVTVKLDLPPWTIILHLGTAMLLFAALLVAARLTPPVAEARESVDRAARASLGLGFVVILLGALVANLHATYACAGFPLCNGALWPAGGLAHLQWIHRLLAYLLFFHVAGWALRRREGPALAVFALVTLQVIVAAAMVLAGFPKVLQATHVAVGAAVWAGLVIAATPRRLSV
ncbi:MAG TPA: COX15/CtaA family protein [Gemmatimonadales bacterium]|nr:COX15/CtaA family protein [Gemmatimonadales bacterium]